MFERRGHITMTPKENMCVVGRENVLEELVSQALDDGATDFDESYEEEDGFPTIQVRSVFQIWTDQLKLRSSSSVNPAIYIVWHNPWKTRILTGKLQRQKSDTSLSIKIRMHLKKQGVL